jgi:hypothetical protein
MAAVTRYKEGVQSFCQREFGTSNLDECRMRMKESYKDVWG